MFDINMEIHSYPQEVPFIDVAIQDVLASEDENYPCEEAFLVAFTLSNDSGGLFMDTINFETQYDKGSDSFICHWKTDELFCVKNGYVKQENVKVVAWAELPNEKIRNGMKALGGVA